MPDGPPLACRTARRLLAALLLRFVLDAVAHVANPPARCLLSSQLIRLAAAAGKYCAESLRLVSRFSRALRDLKDRSRRSFCRPSPDDSPGDTVFCPSLGRPWAHRLEFGIVVSGRSVRSFLLGGCKSVRRFPEELRQGCRKWLVHVRATRFAQPIAPRQTCRRILCSRRVCAYNVQRLAFC